MHTAIREELLKTTEPEDVLSQIYNCKQKNEPLESFIERLRCLRERYEDTLLNDATEVNNTTKAATEKLIIKALTRGSRDELRNLFWVKDFNSFDEAANWGLKKEREMDLTNLDKKLNGLSLNNNTYLNNQQGKFNSTFTPHNQNRQEAARYEYDKYNANYKQNQHKANYDNYHAIDATQRQPQYRQFNRNLPEHEQENNYGNYNVDNQIRKNNRYRHPNYFNTPNNHDENDNEDPRFIHEEKRDDQRNNSNNVGFMEQDETEKNPDNRESPKTKQLRSFDVGPKERT